LLFEFLFFRIANVQFIGNLCKSLREFNIRPINKNANARQFARNKKRQILLGYVKRNRYFCSLNSAKRGFKITIMIEQYTPADFQTVYDIINDASSAYKGIIPADRWHEPYMPEQELQEQLEDGIEFWCYKQNDEIVGVMGIQEKSDVTLIRHAYVRTTQRSLGIGSKLLSHLTTLTSKPVLIGTWADAEWAISFYQKHGFSLVEKELKNKLLNTYWSVPERQIETSVVLADSKFLVE
jgi:N-acetylglutamate synthase-like GNAT family acetyltransferase